MTRPAYSWGPKATPGTIRSAAFLFQCPVSAIPPVVMELLGLWHRCRTLKVQLERWTPLAVMAFSIFESEYMKAQHEPMKTEG